MNKTKAFNILGIEEGDEETVKRAYRLLALKYHPDKNPDEDATAKFQEIHEAYVYLHGSVKDQSTDYKSLLQSFLRSWLAGERDNDVLHEWIRRITGICEEKAIMLLQNIDKHILKTIYNLISKNSDVLHVSSNFIEKMHDVLKMKFENDERIILHPFLDDMENIYKLSVGEKVYLVPLWNHHLVYDGENGEEIYVDCYPLLPESMWIDEYNNIHINIEKNLIEIWEENGLTIEIGSRKINIDKSQLSIIENQMITYIGKGIFLPTTSIHFTHYSKEHTKNEKDKSNVYIHLTISYNH